MRHLITFSLLWLAGCSAAGDEHFQMEIIPEPTEHPVVCEAFFSPDSQLRAATEKAASRWSSATGCDITIDPKGVPLVAWNRLFVDYLPNGSAALSEFPNPEGGSRSPCGLSTWRNGNVAVIDVTLGNVDCPMEYTVLHEMGHALAKVQGHSSSGILADGGSINKGNVIDTSSLELVCSSLPCKNFSVEALN